MPSSGLPAAPEQATASDSAALSGRLEVQEEGPATLLLLVMQGRNPASGRRSRNYRTAVKTIIAATAGLLAKVSQTRLSALPITERRQ